MEKDPYIADPRPKHQHTRTVQERVIALEGITGANGLGRMREREHEPEVEKKKKAGKNQLKY